MFFMSEPKPINLLYSVQWLVLLPVLILSACTPLPTVEQSRDQMWAQYNHQPVDKLLMALGTPERESHLTDGSRLLTYQFSSIYNDGSPYERQSRCEATFMAKAPSYRLENIAMQGDNYECSLLAQGHTGYVRHPYTPPTPYVSGPVQPFYRYNF